MPPPKFPLPPVAELPDGALGETQRAAVEYAAAEVVAAGAGNVAMSNHNARDGHCCGPDTEHADQIISADAQLIRAWAVDIHAASHIQLAANGYRRRQIQIEVDRHRRA